MKTNVKIEVLDIFGHIDSRVAVVVTNGEAGFDNVLHVFMTNETLAEFLNSHREKYPDRTFQYVEDYLGSAVNYTIWNDYEGLSLHSSLGTSFDIAKADLEPLTDVVDSFCVMSAVNHGKMSLAEAIMRMHNKTVYYVGERPHTSLIEKRDTVFGATIIALGEEATRREAIAAFLTPEGAERQAGNTGASVNMLSLTELAALWNFRLPVVIEPHRSFCIELKLEAQDDEE